MTLAKKRKRSKCIRLKKVAAMKQPTIAKLLRAREYHFEADAITELVQAFEEDEAEEKTA